VHHHDAEAGDTPHFEKKIYECMIRYLPSRI
jgi:hypothetical protein